MRIINSDKKLTNFPRVMINTIICSLLKKKLGLDSSIDITDLSIEENEDFINIQLSGQLEVPKCEIIRVITKLKGE